MNKRNKIKTITTVVYLLISIIALYSFVFIIDVAVGWKITLILIALFWILSGILNLIEYCRNK